MVLRTLPHRPRRPPRRGSSLAALAAIAPMVALVLALHRPAATPKRDLGLPLGGQWVRSTLVGSVDALLAVPHRSGVLLAGTADGIWRSDDGGTAWNRDGHTPGGDVYAIAASSRAETILAGASDGRVYASTGAMASNWIPISPVLSAYPVFSLAVAPDGQSALAGTLGALYRGEVRGGNWRWQPARETSGAAITSIAWTPWDARFVFATVFHATPSVLASRDGGRTWRPEEEGLPPNLPTQSLYASGAATREVVLSTMGGGVWRRAPGGGWREISAGLPQRHAMPIAGDPAGSGPLFAGTMGGGVYEREGQADWRPLGHGLKGMSALILSLLAPSATQPVLLAGTGQGLFRYLPSGPVAGPGPAS